MALSTFNITGLASGLDTASMIDQLMALERQPVVRYQQRQAELREVDDAWGSVNTKLSSLRTAVDALRKPDAFEKFVRSSSSDEAVASVAVTGSPAVGSMTFTVTGLARAHQVAYAEMGAADASVWSGTDQELVLTAGGDPLEIQITSSTTLESLAADINAGNAGVSAQVVQTSPGAYRLLLSANESGTANAISVQGAPAALGAATELQAAADAVLDLGGGLTVTRSSNTITDLVAGATITAKQTGTPVTISTARDHEAASTAVQKMVDAANGVLTTVKDLTAYNADTKVAGVLQGDPTARKLAMDLRMQVTTMMADVGGDRWTASTIGISLTRDGLIELDTTKLKDALKAEPAAVAALLSDQPTSSDGAVTVHSSSDRTAAGSYGVEVTTAAAVARVNGAAFLAGPARDLTITVGGADPVVVSLLEDEDAATVADKINTALTAAGLSSVRADVDAGALRLQETRHGAAYAFTVGGSGDWALDGTHVGVDVAGTIGGQAATGKGQRLTATDGDPRDLALDITATAPGTYGTVKVAGSLSSALDRVLRWAEGDRTSGDPDLSKGSIARARDSLKGQIRRFDDQILAFETRLEGREVTLRKKFAALETALAGIQTQTSFLGMLGTQQQ